MIDLFDLVIGDVLEVFFMETRWKNIMFVFFAILAILVFPGIWKMINKLQEFSIRQEYSEALILTFAGMAFITILGIVKMLLRK